MSKPKAPGNSECVKVIIRCRPMTPTEVDDKRKNIVMVDKTKSEISLKQISDKDQPRLFTFDAIYDWNAKQKEIFDENAFPIVNKVLEGYNGTIFCYGQTGTGKTHTMEGIYSILEEWGIMPRAFEAIFHSINCDTSNKTQYLVRCSYMEIYKEDIMDLLIPKIKKHGLEIKEKPDSGVYVKDLTSEMVSDEKEMVEFMMRGKKTRATAATSMNDRSSRSHAIFTVTVETSEVGIDNKDHIRVGKLNMVDLAGSERQSKTHAEGVRLEEAIKINLSLSTLCHVISTLVDQKAGSHIPYRNSKLTRILQDSLGGNTKTVMVANIGPADYNYEETLNTLQYANRAKNIQNRPRINEDPKDAMIREYQNEIQRLRMLLDQSGGTMPGSLGPGGSIIKEKIIKVEDKEKIKKMEELLENELKNIKINADEERKKIEEQKNIAEEERTRILERLKKREEEEAREKSKEQELLKKLKKYEDKVIKGKKVIEEAQKKEFEIKKAKAILEEKRVAELRLANKLKEKEDEQMKLAKKFTSQKEEAETLTKEIQKFITKIHEVDSDKKDFAILVANEREDMINQIQDLTNKLKLKQFMIDGFIPRDEVEKYEKRAEWNKETEEWVVAPPKFSAMNAKLRRPVSAFNMKRSDSEYGRSKEFVDFNMKLRNEQILPLELEKPDNTCEQFSFEPSERVINAINNALKDDDDPEYLLLENTNPIDFIDKRKVTKSSGNERPKTTSM